MPFIAMNIRTGARVDITGIAGPRNDLLQSEMVCPVCGHPMIIKAGSIVAAHFAHKPGRDDCPYAQYAAGETQAHRDCKIAVRDSLSDWLKEYAVTACALEVYIPEVSHARNRIADILFTFPNGWRVAHEIQLAAITSDELQERSDDYMGVGIDCFWWLGGKAATLDNLKWSMGRYGYHLRIHMYDDGVEIGLGSYRREGGRLSNTE